MSLTLSHNATANDQRLPPLKARTILDYLYINSTSQSPAPTTPLKSKSTISLPINAHAIHNTIHSLHSLQIPHPLINPRTQSLQHRHPNLIQFHNKRFTRNPIINAVPVPNTLKIMMSNWTSVLELILRLSGFCGIEPMRDCLI